MTHPIATDKLSTHLDARERKVDARGSDRSPSRPDASVSPAARSDSADVGRASERLAQQLQGATHSRIDSAEQARARVAQLQLDIARDPQGVAAAFGNLTQDAFSAAIAEPSD